MVTRLQKAFSLWQDTATPPMFGTLQGAVSADVVVVGAGITGVTAAALLVRAGKQVVVIDARDLGDGVTGYTTAHIFAPLDARFHTLRTDFGAEGARLIAQSHLEAIEQIAGFVSEYNIECGFQRVDCNFYTEADHDQQEWDDEFDALQASGFAVERAERLTLPFATTRAMRIPNQGQFHPLKYIYAMALQLQTMGVRFYTHSPVRKVEDREDGVRVETDSGAVNAGAVFMATHIPPGINLVDTQVAPYRTYVMAFKTSDEVAPGLYMDLLDPYHYTRIYEQDGDRWLIVGGYDHKTGQPDEANETDHYRDLEEYARAHFTVDQIAYRWSSQVYESADGLAYIGKSPGAQNYYYATGYAGNGMTYSNVAARLVTDLILGRANPYADLYSPARVKPLASAVDYLKENVNVFSHLIGDRFTSDAQTFAAVAPGEGQIVSVDGQQIAAYRDEAGLLTTVSPVCTHLGCIVQWNNAEKSWDCPCHGGRFSATGAWIEGPPMLDLKPIDSTAADSPLIPVPLAT